MDTQWVSRRQINRRSSSFNHRFSQKITDPHCVIIIYKQGPCWQTVAQSIRKDPLVNVNLTGVLEQLYRHWQASTPVRSTPVSQSGWGRVFTTFGDTLGNCDLISTTTGPIQECCHSDARLSTTSLYKRWISVIPCLNISQSQITGGGERPETGQVTIIYP